MEAEALQAGFCPAPLGSLHAEQIKGPTKNGGFPALQFAYGAVCFTTLCNFVSHTTELELLVWDCQK